MKDLKRLRDGEWQDTKFIKPNPLPFVEKQVPEPKADRVGVMSGEIAAGEDIEVEVMNHEREAEVTAHRFVDLLEQGYAPGRAAKALGTSLGALKSNRDVKAIASKLLKETSFTPAARAELVRQGFMFLALDNIMSEDVAEKKLALDALKAAGGDVEVGVTGPTTQVGVGVNLDMSALAGVFESLEKKDEEKS